MTAHRSKRSKRSNLTAAATAIAAALAVATFPARADAQFGGLLKKAKEKAAEKVAEKAVDKAAEKAGVSDTTSKTASTNDARKPAGGTSDGGASSRVRGGRRMTGGGGDAAYAAGPAPTYTANLLEITSARIDQLFKGLDAERAYAAQREKNADAAVKKHDAEMKAYEAKHAAWEKKMADINARSTAFTNCQMSNSAAPGAGGPMMAGMEKMQRKMAGMSDAEQKVFIKQMQELGERGKAAEKRDDRKALMAISDTMYMMMGLTPAERQAAMEASMNASRNRKDCGTMPAELSNPSLMPAEPQPPEERSRSDEAQAAVDKAGASAAGMTVEQYGLLRERIAALVLYNGRPGPAWGFGENERKIVATRRNEFNKYEDILGGNAISWRFSGSND